MKLTGHKTESIYWRYAIVCEADLSEGVAKLSALHRRENEAERVVVPLAGAARQLLTYSNFRVHRIVL